MTVHFETYRPRYRVERVGGTCRIVDPKGHVLDTPYTNRQQALTRCEALQREADRQAKRGPRPCMCCGKIFDSEGVHNRLCGGCRSRESTDWMTAGTTSTGKVRRAASQP